MFTPMLSAPGRGCTELEGMQKWVAFTQLELGKLISKRAISKMLAFMVHPYPLLLTLLRTNLRRNVSQVILSELCTPRSRPKSRIQVQVVYLGGGPRKHCLGSRKVRQEGS